MLKINKIFSKKIKYPLLFRGLFHFCHSRESGNPSSPSLRGAKRRGNLSGFSLIELMVAVVILSMAILGIFQAYSVGFMGMADARDRTVATNYAQEKMEDFKNGPFADITPKNFDDVPGQTKFEREVGVDEIEEGLKKVTTTVRWKNRKDVYKYVELVTLVYDL